MLAPNVLIPISSEYIFIWQYSFTFEKMRVDEIHLALDKYIQLAFSLQF